jgi:hypothetical protein
VAGNDWWIAAEREKLTLDEVQRRAIDYLNARKVSASVGGE